MTLQFDSRTNNAFFSLLEARANFLNCRQKEGQACNMYLETLKAWAYAIEYHGGSVSESYEMIPEYADGIRRSVAVRKYMARNKTLAIAFTLGADKTRYGTLIDELANQYAMGKDQYPADLNAAYSALVSYKSPTNTRAAPAAHTPTTTAAPAAPTPAASASEARASMRMSHASHATLWNTTPPIAHRIAPLSRLPHQQPARR